MSTCVLVFTGKKEGSRFVHRCSVCGRERNSKSREPTLKVNCKVATAAETKTVRLPPPPLPLTEIERRISICQGCEHWNAEKRGCKVCGTCGSGQAMYNGLMRDPAKRCPHPKGNKWGESLPKPLTVAFLTPGLNMGGGERWVASLCQHFDPMKIHAAAVVVGDAKHISPEAKSWFPAYTKIIPDVELLPSVLKQIDLLISWGPVSLDARTKGWGGTIIDVAHGTLGHWDGVNQDGFKVQEAIARQAIKAGAHLAAVNKECLLNYPEEYRDKVTVIPNGAEVSRVQSTLTKQEARAKFGIPPECQKVVLFVGRFAKEKNLQALVDALEFLPGWTLLAAGPKYHLPVRMEGKQIIMPGTVDPPGDLYRAADVLCMPSAHEAHSLTLIEGNLAGVPVVSYDYPAMKHLTSKHGPLARLVPVRCSPVDLAAAIFAAEFDDVRAIKRIATEHYTAEKMGERWQNYLLSVSQTAKHPTLSSSAKPTFTESNGETLLATFPAFGMNG